MLTVLSGMRTRATTEALGALLAERAHDRARAGYGLQLLWQIGATLFAAVGGGEYPVPDYFTMFPPRPMPDEGRSAQEIRQRVLRCLERRKPDGGPV